MTQERYNYIIDTVSFAKSITSTKEFLELLEYGWAYDEFLLDKAKDLRKKAMDIAEGY
jgi:hypothetical protein